MTVLPRKSINTLLGKATYYTTRMEDEQGRWDDNWSTKDGFFVTHHQNTHHVYKVPSSMLSKADKKMIWGK